MNVCTHERTQYNFAEPDVGMPAYWECQNCDATTTARDADRNPVWEDLSEEDCPVCDDETIMVTQDHEKICSSCKKVIYRADHDSTGHYWRLVVCS